jgi:mercuric ion transport protein
MRETLRLIHAGVAWLLVGAIVVQVWLAGAAIFQLGGDGDFETHRGVGYLIGLITLALLVTALPTGLGRRRILQSAGIFGLYVVQSSLPYVGSNAIEALHPVNALVMFLVSLVYARAVWRERAVPAAA